MAKPKHRRSGRAAKPAPQQVTFSSQPIEQLIQSSPVNENWALLDRLESDVGESTLCLYVGDAYMLRPDLITPLYQILESIGTVERLALFLRSTGGLTEVPWKIVSLIREYTKHLTMLVPNVAHSGATHITLAADTLIMTELATLSSVDPTRQHQLLPRDKADNPIPTSVQDLKHCVEFIKTQLGENHSGSDIALIIEKLFQYVHPLALGALEQSNELSRLITRKVLGTRVEKLPPEKIEKIVEQLAGKYFSHAFPISREDVRQDLELDVVDPSPALKRALEVLLEYYDGESKQVATGRMDSKNFKLMRTVFVDSSRKRKVGHPLIGEGNKNLGIYWVTIERDGGTHAA